MAFCKRTSAILMNAAPPNPGHLTDAVLSAVLWLPLRQNAAFIVATPVRVGSDFVLVPWWMASTRMTGSDE